MHRSRCEPVASLTRPAGPAQTYRPRLDSSRKLVKVTAQTQKFTKRKAATTDKSPAAVEQRDLQILGALADGGARSAVIAARTGIRRRTVQHRLLRLREEGLASDPSRGTFRLTGSGQARVLAARRPALIAEPDPSALGHLPQEHQALLRLICDAVVARRELAAVHATNWPGFVVMGPSKTGKTLIAQLVCRRFALDAPSHIHVLPRETSGSIWGRRVPEEGGGYRFERAALLSAPLAVLDEFDKATLDVRRAAQAYLQGDSVFAVEDDRADVRATPLVLLNQDRGIELVPEPYLRRSVVLDTTPLLSATRDIDEVARAALAARLPTVPASLVPPALALPEPARRLLRSALQDCLSASGWRRVDIEALSRIALGRWASDPAAGPERAALAVAADYLLCTATRADEVAEDWVSRIEAAATAGAGDEVVTALPRPGPSARELREAEAERAHEARAALAGRRGELLASLSQALARVPRGLTEAEVVRVGGVRGRHTAWREQIIAARSLEELGRLAGIVEREVLTPLREIRDIHAAAADAAADARRSAAEAKRAAAEQQRAQRERKKQVDAYVAELQACYSRTSVTYDPGVLDKLLRLRCVAPRTEEYQVETMSSMVRRGVRRVGQEVQRFLGPAPAPPIDPLEQLSPYPGVFAPRAPAPPNDREYETKTVTWYVDHSGTTYSAWELRGWGSPTVRAMLRATAHRYGSTLKEPRRVAATRTVGRRRSRRLTPARTRA